MKEDEIITLIGETAVERKSCLDKMSCYEARLKTALQSLSVFLDPEKDPPHEDNQRFLTLVSDPRTDAKGYVEVRKRADELAAFLKKHNAL